MTILILFIAPALVLYTVGVTLAERRSGMITPSKPKLSADLMMAPRLCGSSILSSNISFSKSDKSSKDPYLNDSTSIITPWWLPSTSLKKFLSTNLISTFALVSLSMIFPTMGVF